MNEVGKNAPCPCGSGRKYKYCHQKPFLPSENFMVEIKAFEIAKRIRYKLPPTIQVSDVPTITSVRPYPWHIEISEILKPLNDLKWDTNDKWQRYAEGRVKKLYHKLNAIKYHQLIFLSEEENVKRQFENFTIGTSEYNHVDDNPVLIFSTESFLFQSVSFLDVFAQLIGRNFKLNVRTYEDYGQGLVDKIKKNPLNGYPKQCCSLIDLINHNLSWIRNLIEMRVEVTHYSDLEGLACFLQRRCHQRTDRHVKIYYPSLTDGTRISVYMNDIWNKLKTLIADYSQIILTIYPIKTS